MDLYFEHVSPSLGERPFKCSECGKAFNQKGALQTHMIKHTGEKPHACAFCPAAFSQKGNLQSHVQRVHSEVNVARGWVWFSRGRATRLLSQWVSLRHSFLDLGLVQSRLCFKQETDTCRWKPFRPIWKKHKILSLCGLALS